MLPDRPVICSQCIGGCGVHVIWNEPHVARLPQSRLRPVWLLDKLASSIEVPGNDDVLCLHPFPDPVMNVYKAVNLLSCILCENNIKRFNFRTHQCLLYLRLSVNGNQSKWVNVLHNICAELDNERFSDEHVTRIRIHTAISNTDFAASTDKKIWS